MASEYTWRFRENPHPREMRHEAWRTHKDDRSEVVYRDQSKDEIRYMLRNYEGIRSVVLGTVTNPVKPTSTEVLLSLYR